MHCAPHSLGGTVIDPRPTHSFEAARIEVHADMITRSKAKRALLAPRRREAVGDGEGIILEKFQR